jgi:hypothetical protein
VEKINGVVLTLILASAFLCAQAFGQIGAGQQVATAEPEIGHVPGEALTEPHGSFAGNPFTCSESQKLTIPSSAAKRAKLKAQLMNVLRLSIFDDAKGIVNVTRERQIKELIRKLDHEKTE